MCTHSYFAELVIDDVFDLKLGIWRFIRIRFRFLCTILTGGSARLTFLGFLHLCFFLQQANFFLVQNRGQIGQRRYL